MQTSDACESHTCPMPGGAATVHGRAIFTLRARAARGARPTPWAVRASHKSMGVSHDFFAQDVPPSRDTRE